MNETFIIREAVNKFIEGLGKSPDKIIMNKNDWRRIQMKRKPKDRVKEICGLKVETDLFCPPDKFYIK